MAAFTRDTIKSGDRLSNGWLVVAASERDNVAARVVLAMSPGGQFATWRYALGETVQGEYFRSDFSAAVASFNARAGFAKEATC